MKIDQSDFAQTCLEKAVAFRLFAHYMVAVAMLQSGIADDAKGDAVGPFGLTPADWLANCKDPSFAVDFDPADISDWAAQCSVYGLMTRRALDKLGGDVSPLELYAAQWPNNDKSKLSGALNATATLITQAAKDMGIEQNPSSAIVADPAIPAIATPAPKLNVWPLQKDCLDFYGDPFKPGWLHDNTIDVACPWPLHIGSTPVSHILVHKRCADSLTRVLGAIWDAVGRDPHKIAELHYDVFDGSYNLRPMRGGSQMSMHAFACALDWDADENAFHSQHHLFRDDSIIVVKFREENWEWGGKWISPDAMHFQAARVGP